MKSLDRHIARTRSGHAGSWSGQVLRFIAVVGLLAATAASDAGARQQRVVILDTNYPAAMVFADSVWLGRASMETFSIPVESQSLRLVPPDVDAWSIKPVAAGLSDYPRADTVRLSLYFPYHYRVESMPFGARVYVEGARGRDLLGETPLDYSVKEPLQGTFVLERPGYEVMRVDAGDQLWNRASVALRPDQNLAPVSSGPDVSLVSPGRRHTWIDIAALGTALTAGVLAVHFKTKADHRFDRYKETGDPSLRPIVNRFDTYSGVALGVSQAGLGLFALRLILR